MDKELAEKLLDSLEEIMEWAREVSDEYIDGGDMRREYAKQMREARKVLAEARSALAQQAR